MPSQTRRGLYAGIALLSLGVVVLQVVLTRLYSALFGYHFAFLAVSLGLFGSGLGGVIAYAFPRLVPPEAPFGRSALLAGFAAAATFVALLVILHVPHPEKLDAGVVGELALVYAVSAAPFVLASIPIAAAVRAAADDISRLYLVDLLGAAAAGFLAIVAVRFGALRACLIVAIELSLAGLVFYFVGRRAGEVQRRGAIVAAFALCSVVLLAGDYGASPWLKLPKLRWVSTDRVDFEVWNELGLVTVDRTSGGTAWMRVDASSTMAILDAKTNPPLHPDEMAYVIHRGKGPTLILGAGGGRDVRAALKYGQKDITAVEINQGIVEDVMGGKMRTFSGDLYSRPEVHVTIADGRNFVRGSSQSFRNIVISLVDTSAAASVGALTLAENGLYTIEAFQDDLAHLLPEGTLVVNRWDPELDRLLAIVTEALRREGSARPADHLYACSAARSTALLVKRTKLTPAELTALRSNCSKNNFIEVFAPDDAHGDLHERIVTLGAQDVLGEGDTDVSPPTDDRPFFFYTLPPRRFFSALASPSALARSHPAVMLLVGLTVVSGAIAAAALLVPLALSPARVRRAVDGGARLRALAFFLALGAGFSIVEVALVQHFVTFLGHPTYALSTVLVALLLWAGVGSVLTGRVADDAAATQAARSGQALVVVVALFAVGLGPVLDLAEGLPFPLRLAMTILLLAPLGVLMGSQTPLGVKLVAARAPELVPWCWGLSGLAAVVACGLAPLAALNLGFAAVLLLGGLSYLAAVLLVRAIARFPLPQLPSAALPSDPPIPDAPPVDAPPENLPA